MVNVDKFRAKKNGRPVKNAIARAGGAAAVAEAFSVSLAAVNRWINVDRVPAEYAPELEVMTDREYPVEVLNNVVSWHLIRGEPANPKEKLSA